MSLFRSGSVQLGVGAIDVALTNLAIPFAPERVSCSVRLPNADADFISATVVGAPTEDGFSVALSAPIPSEGYVLDWYAVGGELPAADASSLAIGYAELFGIVAKFLGYPPSGLTEAQTAHVDACIQAGIRNFYYPPKMEGVDETYEWSFLRQSFSVTTTAGVADYRMADGFGEVRGEIYFTGDDIERRPLPVISIGAMLSMRTRRGTGAPRFAAFRFRPTYGTSGQYVEMMLYPTPDRAYPLSFAGTADTGRISAQRPFPLGGPSFAELVTESCLAAAEQRENDEAGLHTQNFNALLVSMIAKDRNRSGATYGFIGDRPDAVPSPSCRPSLRDGMMITYRGITW